MQPTTRVSLGLILLVGLTAVAAPRAWANLNAADSTNAQDLWAMGLTGAGVTVGVWEAFDNNRWEVRDTHESFRSYNPDTGLWNGPSRVVFGDTPIGGQYSSHATHVAGTIAGAHIPGKEAYWGMAPNAQVVSYSVTNHFTQMRNAKSQFGVDITNHSYGHRLGLWSDVTWNIPQAGGGTVALQYRTFGNNTTFYRNLYTEDPRYGQYEGSARSLDSVLYDNPKLLSFWSAGNSRSASENNYIDRQSDNKYVARFSPGFTPINGVSLGSNYWLVSRSDYAAPGLQSGGYDTLPTYSNSKNAIIVGALNDHTADPHAGFITTGMTGFSSFGPTDDGRLGVTIVANGASLSSANNGNDTQYSSKSGTSMAAPNAAGTAALLLEHWRHKTGGYTPDATTQKALLAHTATDVRVNTSNPLLNQAGPDYRSGYGLINGLAAAQFVDRLDTLGTTSHMFELDLNQGMTWAYEFIASGGPVKATLVWNDPAWTGTHSGQDDTRRALVNDLDLLITDELGRTFFPWTLDPFNPNQSATRDKRNNLDNIEQVLADTIEAGLRFTLSVGHTGSITNGTQRFSLLLDGARVPVLGDFNNDGIVNALDIDQFITALTSPLAANPALDLNGDGVINKLDHHIMVTSLAFTARGIGTYFGDANLDGQVDEQDLTLLASAWQTSAGWALGDFNADGVIDEFDLAILAMNWQAGASEPSGMSFAEAIAAVTFVPEPASLALMLTPAPLLLRRRQRHKRAA